MQRFILGMLPLALGLAACSSKNAEPPAAEPAQVAAPAAAQAQTESVAAAAETPPAVSVDEAAERARCEALRASGVTQLEDGNYDNAVELLTEASKCPSAQDDVPQLLRIATELRDQYAAHKAAAAAKPAKKRQKR